MKNPLRKGDYVLATKYIGGDPLDHFYIGFWDGYTSHEPPRHLVVDFKGCPAQIRDNGFRRADRISTDVGAALVCGIPVIEQSKKSVWFWRYHPEALCRLVREAIKSRGPVKVKGPAGFVQYKGESDEDALRRFEDEQKRLSEMEELKRRNNRPMAAMRGWAKERGIK